MCSWACLRHQPGGCCKSTIAILMSYLRHTAVSQLVELARPDISSSQVIRVLNVSCFPQQNADSGVGAGPSVVVRLLGSMTGMHDPINYFMRTLLWAKTPL